MLLFASLAAPADLLDRRAPGTDPVKLTRPAQVAPLEDSVRIARLQALLDSLRRQGGPTVELNRRNGRLVFLFGQGREIWLEKAEFRQGDRVWLRLFSKTPLENPRIRLLGRGYGLYKTSEKKDRIGYQAFLAVDMKADTGMTELLVRYGPKARPDSVRLPVWVMPGEFAGKVRRIKEIEMSEELKQELVDEHWFFDSTLAVGSRSLVPDSFLAWPASGAYTSEYGVETKFEGMDRAWRHKAIDIANAEGTPVYAAADGIVAGIANLQGHGNSVVLAHGQGVHTGYLHLAEVTVEEGSFVRKGQRIGTIGKTGVATGPNLHFEVWAGSVPVNPLSFLPKGDSIHLGTWVDSRRLNR